MQHKEDENFFGMSREFSLGSAMILTVFAVRHIGGGGGGLFPVALCSNSTKI